MIKSYSDTDHTWDTTTMRWIRPPYKKEYVKPIQTLKPVVEKKKYSDMSYKEIIFDIYKECRESENWFTIMLLHDEEDRCYFDSLDKMTGRTNG